MGTSPTRKQEPASNMGMTVPSTSCATEWRVVHNYLDQCVDKVYMKICSMEMWQLQHKQTPLHWSLTEYHCFISSLHPCVSNIETIKQKVCIFSQRPNDFCMLTGFCYFGCMMHRFYTVEIKFNKGSPRPRVCQVLCFIFPTLLKIKLPSLRGILNFMSNQLTEGYRSKLLNRSSFLPAAPLHQQSSAILYRSCSRKRYL